MTHQTSLLSKSLIGAQFAIIGYFILFHPIRQVFGPQDIVAGTLVIAGISLGLSALFTMRQSRFKSAPEPHAAATLIMSGPYAIIRHPMYTALIVATFGLFLNYPVPGHLIAWALLFAVLNIKLSYEERLLTARFPGYAAYRTGTKKLFPFIY